VIQIQPIKNPVVQMVLVGIVDGNLTDATQSYIAHQCNCVTTRSHGLSAEIFYKFKFANVYERRTATKMGTNCAKTPDVPGTIEISRPIKETEKKHPAVIAMFAQYAPGKSYAWKFAYPSQHDDSEKNRLKWFKECLLLIDLDEHIKDVAMPFKIGCGLAGGDWNDYLEAIKNASVSITLYKV
jgi:hypothetical protein